MSTPHTYISTQPFLPLDSPLSTIFSTKFTKGIKMDKGKLLSWPAPPLEWVGHTGAVYCTSYSPNGCYIVTGSMDRTIRIWDAETGSVVVGPVEGHTDDVRSVAYSPNGRHITSGSKDRTIRIWDAETGSPVGKPLKGHTSSVRTVAYSPDGQHIISGSDDKSIQIWDAKIGSLVGAAVEGHTASVRPVARSPDGQNLSSRPIDATMNSYGSIPQASRKVFSSSHQIQASLGAQRPDSEGWLRDSEGGLLYWVPRECRAGLHSPALLTIPRTSDVRSVSLDFDDFNFGTSWTRIFNAIHP